MNFVRALKRTTRFQRATTIINNDNNNNNNNNFFFLNVDNLFLISNAKNTIFQYYSLNTG